MKCLYSSAPHLGMDSCLLTRRSSCLHWRILWLLSSAITVPSGTSGSMGDARSMDSVSPSYSTSMTS